MQRVPTFAQANETVVAIHAEHWKSGRTEGQWRASMRDHVLPRLARKRVDAVTTADVMVVLLPIWSTKRVTAGRVRQRIGAVMKWAVAQGFRDDNPAGDAISAALPKAAVRKQHMRALPHAEVGAAELFDGQGLVFPSPTGRVLNHSALTNLLHGLGIDAVAHGFRSSFRDWAAECTDASREVCELALAHVNNDRVEAAYRRSDLFDRRRIRMNDWAAYVA